MAIAARELPGTAIVRDNELMTRKPFEEQIATLPDDIRDRVLERAAIIWESGVADDEADRRAYELETGRAFPGLARARERERPEQTQSDSLPPTGSSGKD